MLCDYLRLKITILLALLVLNSLSNFNTNITLDYHYIVARLMIGELPNQVAKKFGEWID